MSIPDWKSKLYPTDASLSTATEREGHQALHPEVG